MYGFFRNKSLNCLTLVLVSLLFIFLLIAPTALAYSVGDINDDGRIDVQDVTLVLRHVLGVEALTEAQQTVADVNSDGVVNVQDVALITQKALGLIAEFPDTSIVLEEFTAHFIDVGQGDSILIQTSSQNILIDGGNRGDTVVDYLISQGVDNLELIIGTHPHADHIGGLINVMEAIPVDEVIDPGVAHTTITFEDYLDIIDEKDIKFTEGRAGMTRDLGGGAELEIIHPVSPSSNHLNNASIVARITFGQISFLLTGDAESDAESEMLARDYILESTILKVGHHGSNTSTTQAFLNAVNPEVAVIMCGLDNTYGHPHEETLNKLSLANVSIYRTDLHGNVIIKTDGVTYEVDTIPYDHDYDDSNDEAEPDPDPEPDPEPIGSVNINTASFEELQLIIHIGEERAQEIINLRPFGSLDGLLQVSGIGEGRLQDIKDEGIAYVE